MLVESYSINADRFQRSDLQSQTPQFGEFGDRWQSRASILPFWQGQMTTLHPTPAHRRFQQVANSLWPSAVRLLFFEQFFQSITWDMEHTGNSTHTGTLMVSRQNLVCLFLAAVILWIHDCWFTAIFTQELLTTCAIFAILDHVCAIAFRTVKYDYFAYHMAFIPSFIKAHHQNCNSPSAPGKTHL